MEKNVKIAIIGAGYMALEHLKVFSEMPNVELTGITSRNLKNATSLSRSFGIKTVYKDCEELFKDQQVEGIVIAVSEMALPSILKKSKFNQAKLLIEKPIGLDLNETKYLIDILQKRESRSYIALNRRFFSSTLHAHQLLKAEEGCRIISIRDQESPALALTSGQPYEVCEKWMFANSIHLIDYFTNFARGEVRRVEVSNKYSKELPFFTNSTIFFSSGDIGTYEAIWNAPGPWSVSITTKNLFLELRPLEKMVLRRENHEIIEFLPSEVDLEFKPGLRLQAENFIEAIKNKPNQLADLDDAVKTSTLISELYSQN